MCVVSSVLGVYTDTQALDQRVYDSAFAARGWLAQPEPLGERAPAAAGARSWVSLYTPSLLFFKQVKQCTKTKTNKNAFFEVYCLGFCAMFLSVY